MADPRADAVKAYFQRSCEALDRAAADRALADAIITIAARITQAFRLGGKAPDRR